MIEFIKSGTQFDFVGKFKYTTIISLVLVLASLYFAVTKMKYGVDFRGGAEIQIKFDKSITLDELRTMLDKKGFSGATVQTIGEDDTNEYLVKVLGSEENINQITHQISDALTTSFENQGPTVRKVDMVGPKAGAELRMSGFLAMFWAMLAIMIYVGLRFDFRYSPGAIIALFHDVSLVLGYFALTGTEFTLQIVAAILAVIGYSVNDTVIVYDRVREHEEKYTGLPLATHINNATNETLSRTILTSGATLFVTITMMILGGLAIRDFFIAMTIGIVVGTYSSVFIAAPVTLSLDRVMKKK